MTSVRRKITAASPVVVVGSGLAGMSAALRIADHRPVLLVTKHGLGDGSTSWAQGGIAAAIGPDDSVDAHAGDTMAAGSGRIAMVSRPIWTMILAMVGL